MLRFREYFVCWSTVMRPIDLLERFNGVRDLIVLISTS